jgi:hypothetical protein
MSFARQVDLDEQAERAGRKRPDQFAGDSALAPPIGPSLEGPAALRPDALRSRQAVLGNAHVGRVFRSPAADPAGDAAKPEEKQGCSCPDEEHCTCPK